MTFYERHTYLLLHYATLLISIENRVELRESGNKTHETLRKLFPRSTSLYATFRSSMESGMGQSESGAWMEYEQQNAEWPSARKIELQNRLRDSYRRSTDIILPHSMLYCGLSRAEDE